VSGVADRFVLDTSAILTLIEDEPGADRVEEVLHQAAVWLPWVVLLETYYVTEQERGRAEADHRYALLKQLPLTILWQVDEINLLTSARLKAAHRLSLADAMIAGLALQLEATLLHKDPEFEVLQTVLPQEALPYK
jgi:predicted nucleic acid-binding protein